VGHFAVQIPQDKGLVNVNGCMQTLGFLIDSLTFGIRSKVKRKMSSRSIPRVGMCLSASFLTDAQVTNILKLPLHVGGQADLSLSMSHLSSIYMEQASEHIGAIVTNTVLQ
jgi:hypothetical protein